jgi:glycosyltransferase involved in cell wall biosynthesis
MGGFKVKVLNVLLDNHIGGPQIRVLSVAKELRKYGIETIMLSPKGGGDFAQRARNEHFKAYQIMLYGPKHFNSFVSVLANIKWFFTFPLSAFTIAKIIKKEKIEIVHVQGLLNLQAPVAGLLTRRKIVWHLISSLYPKTLVSFLMPFITMIADQIVVVAEKLGEYYLGNKLKSTDTNVSIIYECIDVDTFNPFTVSKDDIDKLKKEFNINPFDKIVGCIGNINPAKGYEYFIDSANLIKEELDNVKFIIVGAKSNTQKHYYLKLQTLVSSLKMGQNIIFTGKRDDIPQLLSTFDVFVLPSIAEGTPLAVLEAMAMEKTVAATDVGAVSEQILDGGTGIIVPPQNPKAMAEAVIYLLEHPKEGIKMGKKGRERVKEIFSLERCVEEHKRLYEKV